MKQAEIASKMLTIIDFIEFAGEKAHYFDRDINASINIKTEGLSGIA